MGILLSPQLLLSLALSCAANTVFASEASVFSAIRSCAPVTQCEDGMGKLDASEREQFQQLLMSITPGMTEAQISSRFGRKPFNITPKLQAWGQAPGTTSYKALWSMSDPPSGMGGVHFDVLFMNDQAVLLNWYAARLRKVARAYASP